MRAGRPEVGHDSGARLPQPAGPQPAAARGGTIREHQRTSSHGARLARSPCCAPRQPRRR